MAKIIQSKSLDQRGQSTEQFTVQSEESFDADLLRSQKSSQDKVWENILRPVKLSEYAGQDEVKQKLKICLEAAKMRREPLDHVLLSGPPGLGKTTLAMILAHEMGVDIKVTSAPAIEKKGDLAAILTSLKPFTLVFIDEIHRLPRQLEEYLYTAMEDYYLDIITGEGLAARSMKFQIPPFTLVGATTRSGLLNAPFRARFGIVERLEFYTPQALSQILVQSAGRLQIDFELEGIEVIARRSRGTPRIANRLLKRVRDYAQVLGAQTQPQSTPARITKEISEYALDRLGVDQLGLDPMDRQILFLIAEKFLGGPVGIDTLAAALSEEAATLEEVYEPFLLQQGLLQKTTRGRMLTMRGREYCKMPSSGPSQPEIPL
jgi:Holliday junction DNA helicase RuvB